MVDGESRLEMLYNVSSAKTKPVLRMGAGLEG
jgi:hypothetical protein